LSHYDVSISFDRGIDAFAMHKANKISHGKNAMLLDAKKDIMFMRWHERRNVYAHKFKRIKEGKGNGHNVINRLGQDSEY